MKLQSILVIAILAFGLTESFAVADDGLQGLADLDRSTVVSDHFLQLKGRNVDELKMEGEQAMHFGDMDRAMAALHKALELNPNNMDSRMMYTQAMESKLHGQSEPDPRLFNAVVKQWVYIYKKAEFQDQKVQAQGHLQSLTGSAPTKITPIQHYLTKVLLPEDAGKQVALDKRDKSQ